MKTPAHCSLLTLRPVAFGLFLLACPSLQADVKMPAIFGDHMVLQQDAKLPVWGTAEPAEKVTVTIAGKSQTATADANGKWVVKFEPLTASNNPVQMTVAGKNTLTFQDVLVGEVWLCSGQSNMAFLLASAAEAGTAVRQASDPQVRFFQVALKTSLEPQSDVAKGQWVVCSPETARTFSAVGYFFGRELRQNLQRPVGLIGSSVGGTPAQAWTSLESLKKEPLYANFITTYEKVKENYAAAQAAYPKLMEAYAEEMKKWKENPGSKRPAAPTSPEGGNFNASVLFNGMIAPLVPYAIKGAIWYQGESGPAHYEVILPLMIKDWRAHWGYDFTFLIVQLPNYGEPQKNPSEGGWAITREAQLKALSLPNTGMAVTIDVGEPKNLHPPNKSQVGRRLGLAAEHIAYQKNIVHSGPIYDTMKVESGKIRLTFKSTGGGLIMGTPPPAVGVPEVPPPTELTGFAIAGADKKWDWAKAKIEGNSVVVWNDQVTNPVAVRYGWAASPACNLYNKEGLPASPFRTDDWEPWGK